MIILQKLTWDNCFSYGKGNEVNLAESTLTQLVGTNGVGKSSIPLILEEVLFNKNSKNVKKADIANRYVNQGYDISLDFTVDDDQYNITVNRRATLKCKLTKNDEDISSHTASNTYKTLGEILGIDFKTFTQLVYQNTNTSLQFLTATDTNRKKFLIDLLKLDDYVAYFETFKEGVRTATQEVTVLNAKTDTIVKWLTDNKLETYDILSKVKLPKISEKDEELLRQYQVDFENISDKNKKIIFNNNLLEQLKSIDINSLRSDYQKYPEKKDTSKIIGAIGAWKSELSHEVNMRDKYESLKNSDDAECPTCEQPIDFAFIENKYAEHNERAEQCSKFIETDITENGGQMILLTAQHLCIKTPANSFKNCKTLNSLSRAVKRVTADSSNELEPVKITRTDKKYHICELLPNMKAEKDFSTFEEVRKLFNRTEGKTACNLTEAQTQELIQFLGKYSTYLETNS